MAIDWDLSGRHTIAEVNWPNKRLDKVDASLESAKSVRIRLPEEKVLEMRDKVNRIILERKSRDDRRPDAGAQGEIVNSVEVDSEPLSVKEAHRRALFYVEQFDLSRAALESWRERRGAGVDPVTDRTALGNSHPLGGRDGPTLSLELVDSADDELPWALSLLLYWARDD